MNKVSVSWHPANEGKRRTFTVCLGVPGILFLVMVLIGGCFILPAMIEIVLVLAIVIVIAGITIYDFSKNRQKTIAVALALPVFLSAFQNVYLGLAANRLTELELSVLLTTHFMLELLYMVFYLLQQKRISKTDSFCILILAVLTVQGVLLYLVYPSGISAFLANYRNVVSCMLFFWVASKYSSRMDIKSLNKALLFIAWSVVVFGIIELLLGNRVWKALNITRLWTLKGIKMNGWIPNNWYSSERIRGQQIRRMVSSFADPVNLGTYLFASFVYAWYKKKRILAMATILCCVLTISKGALLGFLIFFIVLAWFKDRSKLLPIAAVAFGLVVGICFISYSRSSSTGSVFLHLTGFFSSFGLMLKRPFGYGLGRIGVLSWLLSEDYIRTAATETGIGMIIAQLGVIGLGAYIVFFVKLILIPQKWNGQCLNAKIAYYCLVLSFFANAMFNEVALSPNSCVLYFLLIGVFANSGRSASLFIVGKRTLSNRLGNMEPI